MADFPPPSLALDAETLLSHSAWLANFARALVANEADIDDVVQQTLATALARPPRHTGNLRGWLGTVARNVVRSTARSDTARAAREVALPPPPPVENPAKAVARAELRRRVVECVLALDEPYRSTVVLRFFEEQEVHAIARLTRSGEDTVRTRIRRGVQRVRELLERQADEEDRGSAHEGVAARVLLLSRLRDIAASADRPFVAGGGGARGSSSVSRGFGRAVGVQTTKRVLVGAAVVAAAGAGWWWKRQREAQRDEVAVARHDPPPSAPTSAPLAATVSPEAVDRSATPAPSPTSTPPVAKPRRVVKTGTLRGFVRDARGIPVPGAHVWAIASPSHEPIFSTPDFANAAGDELELAKVGDTNTSWIGTVSGPDGSYSIDKLPMLPGWAVGALATSLGAELSEIESFDHEHEQLNVDLELVPGLVMRGRVVDENGALLGNAQVTLFTTYQKTMIQSSIVSAPYGEFLGEFDIGFRCGEQLELECRVPGFVRSARMKIPIKPSATLVNVKITMRHRAGTIVRGRIVDPRGQVAALDQLLDQTLPNVASIERPARLSVRAISAVAPVASAPPVAAPAKAGIEGRIDYPAGMYEFVVEEGFKGSLELRLGDVVVGSADLVDLRSPPDLAFDVAKLPRRGGPTTFTVRFVDAESKQGIDFGEEALAAPLGSYGAATLARLRVDSDPTHGVIKYGCMPGPMTIRAQVHGYAATVFHVDVPDERPRDEPLTLEIPRASAGVRGVVVHADGRPVSKARLAVYRVTSDGLSDATGQGVATNPDGEFEFDSLSKGEHVIVASGSPDDAPAVARFTASDPPAEIELRMDRGALVRFQIAPKLAKDDAQDTELTILDHDGVPIDASRTAWRVEKQTFDERSVSLRPGHYTAVARREGDREARVEFDVPAGDTIEIGLEPRAR